MRRNIKRKTYANFLCVLKAIESKGYKGDEAIEIVHKIFDNYEANTQGLSVWGYVDLIIPADEYKEV